MVETRDVEGYAIEIGSLTNEITENFFREHGEQDCMFLLKDGKYAGVLSLEIFRRWKTWLTDRIVVGDNIFQKARNFFEIPGNQGKWLGLTDADGNLLTFLVWNQRQEQDETILTHVQNKIEQLLQKGYVIQFENWDEYTERMVENLPQGYEEQILLEGRNWELLHENQKKPTGKIEGGNCIRVDKAGIYFPTAEPEVKCLLELKDEYINKKLYYCIESNGMLYTLGKMILQEGLKIDGLCCVTHTDIKRLAGYDIERIDILAKDENAYIMIDTNSEISYISQFIDETRIVVAGECYTERVYNTAFQFWGTGAELSIFRKSNPLLVVMLNSNKKKLDVPGIIGWQYKSNRTLEEYVAYMNTVNKNVPLYADTYVYETRGADSQGLQLQNWDMAIEQRKKCLIYGVKSHYTNRWIQLMERFHMEFKFMEDDDIIEWYGYPVESIDELPYYDADEILVVVNKPYEEYKETVQMLKDYGIGIEKHNAISIYEVAENQCVGSYFVDLCVGFIPQVMTEGKYPGYAVFGDDIAGTYKIMILGGSTSDASLFNYVSWPEALYNLSQKENKSVTIYDGAVAGYYSMQELSKCIRDIRYLKPDMVISFSGINDNGKLLWNSGMINGLDGVMRNYSENSFAYWLENEAMMQQTAEESGAKFFCIAQPQLYQREKLNKYEYLSTMYDRNNDFSGTDPKWIDKVKHIKENYPWMVDMTDILDDYDVYIDHEHVTTEGNEIIAQHIYDYIKDEIK